MNCFSSLFDGRRPAANSDTPIITLQPSKLRLSHFAGGAYKMMKIELLVGSERHWGQTQSIDKWSSALPNNVPVFFCKIQDRAITINTCTPQTRKVSSFFYFQKPLQHKAHNYLFETKNLWIQVPQSFENVTITTMVFDENLSKYLSLT